MRKFNRDPVLENYQKIRSRYKAMESLGSQGGLPPLTDRHGFHLRRDSYLTSRFAGIDKLFYSLVRGIVDDPDFAVKKDPKIYERMMRDPQIFYCLMIRRSAVASQPWVVKPPAVYEKDPTVASLAAAAEKRIRQIPRFSELMYNIMDALLPGLSMNELIWKQENAEYIVEDHYPINKDRIKFNKQGELFLKAPSAPYGGLKVPPYKFIRHTYGAVDGSWRKPGTAGYLYYGRGLADTPLYHYFHFKMLALKYFLKEMERFGMPFKILYTGPQNQQLAEKMNEIMLALKNDAVVTIPGKKGEVNVDVAKTRRSGNAFSLFIEYVDKLITKTILGQELMTEVPGVGSYAAAQVQRSVFGLINSRDMEKIKGTLNRTLLTFDAQLNTPNLKPGMRPVFDFKRSATEESAEFLRTVKIAQGLGLAVSEAQVREYTGLKEPAEGEKILGMGQAPAEEAGSSTETERINNNEKQRQQTPRR